MTGSQIRIIKKLVAGEKILKYDGHLYAWHDKNWNPIKGAPHVNQRTLENMFKAGLLRIGALPGEPRARYLPTDIAAYEVTHEQKRR